jgi:hypothetical protein
MLQASSSDIVFGKFQGPCAHGHGCPAAGTHDGGRIKTALQKVLRRACAHRVPAEGIDVLRIETDATRGIFQTRVTVVSKNRSICWPCQIRYVTHLK